MNWPRALCLGLLAVSTVVLNYVVCSAQDRVAVPKMIVITSQSTELKRGNTVIGTARKGQRFVVRGESSGWYLIDFKTEGSTRRSWLNARDVRVVHPIFSLLDAGKIRLATKQAKEEYEILSRQHGSADRRAVDALNRRGLARLASGDATSAASDFRTVVNARNRLDGTNSAGAAEAINNLAVALYRAGEYAEVHRLLKQSLQIRKNALGPDHIETLRSTVNVINFDAVVNSTWHGCENTETKLQEKLLSRESAGQPSSADLFPLREFKIRHPKLRLTFGNPADDDDPLKDETIPETVDAARLLTRLGLLTGEFQYFKKAATLNRKLYGPTHLQTVLALANVAGAPRFPFGEPELIPSADPQRARQLKSALEMLNSDTEVHQQYIATVLHNLGICLLSDNRRKHKGRELLQQALVKYECQGKTHPRTGLAHETLGLADYILHDYAKAAEHLARAYDIQRESLGPNHVFAAASLNSSGVAHYHIGNVAKARVLIENALVIRKNTLGVTHDDTFRSMNDLGVVLTTQGDYDGARQLFKHTLDLLKRVKPQRDYLIEEVESNLWVVRLQMGDYQPARRFFEAILRSDDSFADKGAFESLATLARLEGRLDDARRLLEQAAKKYPNDLAILNNLGAVARESGDLETAARLLSEVVAKRTEFSFDAQAAFSLTSLALVEQRQNKFDSARKRLLKVLEYYKEHFGEQNPRTTEVLRFLGETELLAGNLSAAREALETALQNKVSLAHDLLPTLSEAEALAYVIAFDERDLLLESIQNNTDVPAAYEVVWKTRAIATRALATRHIRFSDDPDVRAVQTRLMGVRRALAALIVSTQLHPLQWRSRGQSWPEIRHQQLRHLNEEKERLERELARALKQQQPERGRGPDAKTSVREFLAGLPGNVAVVDILRVHKTAANREWHYEAFVLTSLGEGDDLNEVIHRVPLGAATEIDAAVTEWRTLIAARRGGVFSTQNGDKRDREATNPPRSLRRLVWEKLESHFGSATAIVLIPDGLLTAVPWAALPGDTTGSYLIEKYAVSTAAFPQRVHTLLQPTTIGAEQELLAGGIDFENKPTMEDKVSFKIASTRGAKWATLPGTREEVREIAALSSGKTLVLQGVDAHEGRLLSEMQRSRFVHLATHGFFADPDTHSATMRKGKNDHLLTEIQMASSSDVSTLHTVIGRNPLVLSGIVLAGAGAPSETNEYGTPVGGDGILTAEEVAVLDLSNTELVVLSACETGLGEVAGGEGVFGLQRSFALAGAKSTIASLWKVEDRATRTLMIEFYRNLWTSDVGKLEALRQAQLTMLKRYQPQKGTLRGQTDLDRAPLPNESDRLQPYFWAAFVLSGDWR